MALRTIRIMGDEVLTKVCREVKKVTPRISELIDDMLETMYDACGVGLAAPQVGVLRRIVVIDVGEGPIVMINPEILELSDEQVERIRELMVSSGAFAKHEQLIEQKSQAVFEALEAMNLDELTHAALTDIVGRALRRKA